MAASIGQRRKVQRGRLRRCGLGNHPADQRTTAAVDQLDALKAARAENPGIDLLSAEYGDYRAKAKQITENLLQRYPEIAGVFSPAGPELPLTTCGLYRDAKLLNACEIGSWGAAVIDELAPTMEDTEIINYTSDGFEGTELDLILRAKGIVKLYFTGQCIEHVVATTFKRAVNMGYEATLLTDCTSGFTDENYRAMMNILPLYGELMTSRDFIMS